ncbi:MAG: RDD family protein [Reichenbachiella sp.]
MNYIGFWKRFFAYVLDIIPITGLVFVVFYFFLGFDLILENYTSSDKNFEARRTFLESRNIVRNAAVVVWILYGFIMNFSKFQGTHGKVLLGMKIEDLEGNRLTAGQSLKRSTIKITGAIPLFLGFIWIVFRKDKAAWHDLIAHTRVVKRQPV